MNVKELIMKFSGREGFFDRYIELYPLYADYEREAYTDEQLKEGTERFCRMFSSFLEKVSGTMTEENGDILFVTKNVGMFFDEEDELNSWVSKKDEILKKAGEEFTMWNGESRIEHYAYDMSPLPEILSHEVFVYEADEMDAACEIINEITFFGMEEESRNNRIGEIVQSLEEQEKELEAGTLKTFSADEVFKEIFEEILESASDEEREAILKEREESEKNKGRDDAYMRTALHINHIQCVQAVMEYYRQGILDGKITF